MRMDFAFRTFNVCMFGMEEKKDDARKGKMPRQMRLMAAYGYKGAVDETKVW